MDINKMKELKRDTETTIRDILLNFSNQTGLVVESLEFQMTEDSFVKWQGDNDVFSCTSVEMVAGIERY